MLVVCSWRELARISILEYECVAVCNSKFDCRKSVKNLYSIEAKRRFANWPSARARPCVDGDFRWFVCWLCVHGEKWYVYWSIIELQFVI